jgi:hypothetical protein
MEEAILVDRELREIARTRQALHAREATLLVRAEELELWSMFGCATFFEYLERFCDIHPRTAREYVRVARALAQLPVMRAQLEAEQIVYSTARELTRIATPETETEWLRAVSGLGAREIEEEVSDRKRGDRPDDPKDPDRRVKLVLEVRASTFAAYVEKRTRLANERGERLTDDELVEAFCRDESAGDDGQAPYQLAIMTCGTCTKSYQIAAGREIEVALSDVERARCDARHLGDLESDAPQRTTTSVSPATRRRVLMRDRFMCWVPGCRSQRHLDVHHIEPQSEGGSHKPSNLITLCAGHHRHLHEGKLILHGKAPFEIGFEWRGDPSRLTTRHWRHADDGPLGREGEST